MEIRDSRDKEWFWLDNEYLNGYARLLKPTSSLVYISLCRHANNKTQSCFPSMELIAEELGMQRSAISRAIKELEDWNIIKVITNYDKKTKQRENNVYTLTNKTTWKDKPCNKLQHGSHVTIKSEPCNNDDESHVTNCYSNKTNINNTNITITATKVADSISKKKRDPNEKMDIDEFISYCKKSPQKHIQVIGEWADGERPNNSTYGEWQSFIKRNLRASQMLAPYSIEKIEKAYNLMAKDIQKTVNGKKTGFITKYTLETVVKYIDLI